jgi:thymidylate synthase
MIIEESSPLTAWQSASAHLMTGAGEDFNLLLSFPCAAAVDETPMKDYDPRTVLGSKFDCARDIANTIFPAKTWTNSATRNHFYERYLDAHRRGRRKSWGTYFERMITFGNKKVNQLERVIIALRTWPKSYRAAFLMHTSSSETDKLRPLGGPCLQYIQFSCPSSTTIDLVAVYRNHDYCNKVLGNLFGLSRLLRFVCEESGRNPGRVSCLSIHAYFNASVKKQKLLTRIA